MSIVGSVESAGSAGSRRSKTRQYHTLSKTSSVDESLFGAPQRVKDKQRQRSAPKEREASPKATKGRRSKEPEYIQVITKDLIRKLKVPDADPSGRSVILDGGEFSRLQAAATVLTLNEREAMMEDAKRKKEELLEQCEQRKVYMQTMEMSRKDNEKLTDLEQEAKEMSQYLLENANEQMEEQEDEIKKLNELILNAKCHAIRDAQLIEKVEVKKEMLDEEKRLDQMMEIERQKALKEYEIREQLRKEEQLKGAHVLRHQIDENEQQRILNEEKKDQETIVMLKYLDKLQDEDMDVLIKKRELQEQIMRDVAKSNEEIKQIKEKKKEQEKLAEIKVMDYLKDKAAREEAYHQEMEKARSEKEREIARLRAQQERAKDKQAEKDALRAKRNQEEAEREWRKKEREEAEKKALTEQQLRKARADQVKHKEHFLAVQAGRDRVEFERVLRAQKEQAFKDESTEKQAAVRRHQHADEVRLQIREKEKDRINARKDFFEEGNKLDQEAKARRQKLDDIKKRKLQELRSAGVPDKYCNEVARRIEAPPPSLSNMY